MEIKTDRNSSIQSQALDNKTYEVSKINKTDKEIDKVEPSKTQEANKKDLDSKEVKSKVNEVNKQLQDQGLVLSYTQDADSKKMVLELKDSNTNEVIKQIPSKEMLQIADNIDKFLKGYDNTGNTATKGATNLLINYKV